MQNENGPGEFHLGLEDMTAVNSAGTHDRAVTHALTSTALAILGELKEDARFVAPGLRIWWSNYLESHTPHFLNLLSMLPVCGPPNSLLDVGSFPGQFAVLASRLGFTTTALDLDPSRCEDLWPRHDVMIHRVDVERDVFPLQSDSFEVVVLAEVLEHLRINPIHALRECFRVTKPRGWMVTSVPNVSPRHRIRFLLGRDYQGDIISEFESLERIGHMGHFRLYSRREVERLLEHVGFHVEFVRIAGWLPGGRWKFIKYLGPFRDAFRSHLYLVAEKPEP